MKPPVNRITVTTIGEALEQMKSSQKDYAYVVSDQGYQGAVLQETLEQAVDGEAQVSDLIGEDLYESRL